MRQTERRAKTFATLVEAASRAFAAAGYEEASLDAIANSASLSKGAVYAHFPTKQDLFLAVVEDTLDEALRRVDRVAEEARGGNDVAEAWRCYETGAGSPQHYALMAEIWRRAVKTPEVRALLDAYRERRRAILGQAMIDAGLAPREALRQAEFACRLIDGEMVERRLDRPASA